jgi:hypothetical protein
MRGPRIPPARQVQHPWLMSAVLLAAYDTHRIADGVRTRLVEDGFPTDRVQLTSSRDLGQARLVPRNGVGEKLTQYFRTLLQTGGTGDGEDSVRLFQRAVLDGRAVLAVQPRGEVEMRRALELLEGAGPVELRGADLQSQAFEHAAAESETPVLGWLGKVLVAPGASDTI